MTQGDPIAPSAVVRRLRRRLFAERAALRRMARTLREARALERILFEATFDSAFILDPHGIFLAANEIRAARLGHTASELVGKDAREAMAEIRRPAPGTVGVVSSGYSDDPMMTDPRRYGFRAALAKPYQTGEMQAVLRAIFGECIRENLKF